MLNLISEVGKIVSEASSADLTESLIKMSNQFKYMVGLNFDLSRQQLNFDLLCSPDRVPISEEKLSEYAYTGNEKGTTKQFSPTTERLAFLLSQSLPNLRSFLPEDSELAQQLTILCSTFFEAHQKDWLLRASFLEACEISLPEAKRNFKDKLADYRQAAEAGLVQQLNIKPKETLYTLLINKKPLSSYPEYRILLKKRNLDAAFASTRRGYCALCSQFTETTQDMTRFTFKFYMTDKISFASAFNKKNFYKAVAVCRTCYRELLLGEKWIQRHLQTRLGGFQTYIIPQLFRPEAAASKLFNILAKIPNDFNEIKNIKQLQAGEIELISKQERSRSLKQNPFAWNFLFYQKSQSSFKILTLIRDVSPSRLLSLQEAINRVDEKRQFFFRDHLVFDLDRLYWLIPLKKKSGADLAEKRKLLQLYDHIISGYPLQAQQLFQFFSLLAHLHYHRSYAIYQIKAPQEKNLSAGFSEFALAADTIRWNLFLAFLKELNLIEGDSGMSEDQFAASYPNGLKAYLETMEYTTAQSALAILGYVMGTVAYAQGKSGLSNKPILAKVNYQGMSEEKIIRLSNELFEKIRQYRNKIGHAERWWALAKETFDLGRAESMTAQERLFYLLSGYAFNVLRAGKAAQNQNIVPGRAEAKIETETETEVDIIE